MATAEHTNPSLEREWQETEPLIKSDLSMLDKMYWVFVTIRLALTIAVFIVIYPYVEDFLSSLVWYLRYITILGIGSLIWLPINFVTTLFSDSIYKGRVLRTIISVVMPGAHHSDSSTLSEKEVNQSRLYTLNKLHYHEAQDNIAGTVGTTEFDFNEILVKDFERHFDEDLPGALKEYRGFFMKVRLANPLDGCTILSTNKEIVSNASEADDMTPFEAETLSNKFHTCTTNPSEAARLLTPAFATRLSETLSLYSSICHYTEFSLSFCGQYMYVMSDNDNDFFEVCETLEEARKDFNMLHLIKCITTLPALTQTKSFF